MPAPVRARLDQILPLVLARLRAVTGLPPEACFLSQRKRMPYDGLGDQYVWVRVQDDGPDPAVYEGGGRIDTRETVTLAVVVRTRLATDTPAVDTQWLTDQSLGHLLLVHQVMDALVTFYPQDSDGNVFTVPPLAPAQGTAPVKDDKQTEWGESVRHFVMQYELALDQTYQGGT